MNKRKKCQASKCPQMEGEWHHGIALAYMSSRTNPHSHTYSHHTPARVRVRAQSNFAKRLSVVFNARTHTHSDTHFTCSQQYSTKMSKTTRNPSYSFAMDSKRMKKKHIKRSLPWRSIVVGGSGGGAGGVSVGGGDGNGPHTIILYFQSVNDFRFYCGRALPHHQLMCANTFSDMVAAQKIRKKEYHSVQVLEALWYGILHSRMPAFIALV